MKERRDKEKEKEKGDTTHRHHHHQNFFHSTKHTLSKVRRQVSFCVPHITSNSALVPAPIITAMNDDFMKRKRMTDPTPVDFLLAGKEIQNKTGQKKGSTATENHAF